MDILLLALILLVLYVLLSFMYARVCSTMSWEYMGAFQKALLLPWLLYECAYAVLRDWWEGRTKRGVDA